MMNLEYPEIKHALNSKGSLIFLVSCEKDGHLYLCDQVFEDSILNKDVVALHPSEVKELDGDPFVFEFKGKNSLNNSKFTGRVSKYDIFSLYLESGIKYYYAVELKDIINCINKKHSMIKDVDDFYDFACSLYYYYYR